MSPKATIGIGMDCCVIPLKFGGLNLVQTTDFFYPNVDDPYIMGKITCANVLSDLYAMGIVQIDSLQMIIGVSTMLVGEERRMVIELIQRGFADQAKFAGVEVSGGNVAFNPWMMIGGTATAVCSDYLLPNNATEGDVLVLTKPLGTQIAVNLYLWLNRPDKWNKIKGVTRHCDIIKAYRRAIDSMSRLNRDSALLMRRYNAHGATDVTGFGLLGHAENLARCQSNPVSFLIYNIPVIAKLHVINKACGSHFPLVHGRCPETSGGLLIILPQQQAAAFCRDLQKHEGCQAWIIGVVQNGIRSARIEENVRIIDVPSKDQDDQLW